LPFSLAIPIHHFPISSPNKRTSKKVNRQTLIQFDLWQTKQGKKYGASEDAQRKKLFLVTDAFINKHNSQKNVTFLLGHNKFSDMVNLFILDI
jgi:hypothetical protein